MYDPTIARFLQEDTYRGDINDPLSLNLYSYCHNEPIMYSDPSGHFNLFSKDDWVGLYNKGKQAVTQVVNTVGSFISNPIETLSKANEKYIKPFIENTLGISKDNKVYKAVKYVGTRAAGIAANITNVARDTLNLKNRMTGIYTDIPSAALSQANIEIKNKLGLIDAQTYTNLKQRNLEIINDNISFVKDFYSNLIPGTINGIKNDFITTFNAEKAKNFFFNPDASLKSVAEYEMSAFNTVTLASSAGNFAQAGIRAGISRIESSAISNIGISETSLAATGDSVGSLLNGTKTGPLEMNLQVFRKKRVSNAKTDFYVTPSGEAIPSTGYRYMSEKAPYLDELNKTKVIPENPNGTYFSFDKYDVASPGKLQVPHDASVRGSFDTLQIINDIRVPYGNWGKASHLEPITNDFPEFGPGGATQVITNSKINLDEMTKLPK